MGKSLITCNFRLFVLFQHCYIIIPYYHKAINQNLSNVLRLTGIAVIKGMHTISPRQPHMVIQRGVRWCTTAGYPAAPSLDLKHFAERWELKDPLLFHPFWLLNRNVLFGRCSACLYTRESLSMLIGQPSDHWSGTQLPKHITPCLLFSRFRWYFACGTPGRH